MSRYAFTAAPSAVAGAPKAAAFPFDGFAALALEALDVFDVFEATAFAAFDGARS
ncbi:MULTISPECIES: hypothetical protein [unclassified Streptomyces]|uniref:hypothetical protein n=1 Tax=unclassified Streptomyces TaxID=2593676 RepID=UPI000A9696E7|nr:hypothetical protein [Streptomyces sp. NRRL F-2747]